MLALINFLRSVFGFLVILGPLVIVHEFGHYLFARIFGVKAEIFSIGFGPTLWKKQCGETELRISAIPLGGYVKLLGEDREAPLAEEEQKRALHKKEPWKRFFVFFGGPLFNFLFAIVIFAVILIIGDPQPASVIGRVLPDSAAQKVGFQSGDKIVSINAQAMQRFADVDLLIRENPEKTLVFEVLHPHSSAPVKVNAIPEPQHGFGQFGESKAVGEIDGLQLEGRGLQIGISNPDSPAGKAGVVTGDQVVEVNGLVLKSWEDLDALYEASAPGTLFRLKIKKADTGSDLEVHLTKGSAQGNERLTTGSEWGLFSSELFVDRVVPKSPAEGAGVHRGDRLVGIGPKNVNSFFQLRDNVQISGETLGKVNLSWERGGKLFSAEIKPTATPTHDQALRKVTQYTVGVVPMPFMREPEMILEREWNPFLLAYKATERMVSFSWRNFVSIQKMIVGDVSVGTLGGPIMIGKLAGESLALGIRAILTTMALLSIGLGVLNILPVPVLDGGHLMLLGIETIRGKPLNMRTMEIIQLVGLSLILLLMAVVIGNDLKRLTYF